MTNLTSDAIVFSLFPSPLSTPGGADKSYGIHVAQLAGIPRQVIHRAEEILDELERKIEARARRRAMRELTLPPALQLTLFGSETDPLVEELKTLPIDNTVFHPSLDFGPPSKDAGRDKRKRS